MVPRLLALPLFLVLALNKNLQFDEVARRVDVYGSSGNNAGFHVPFDFERREEIFRSHLLTNVFLGMPLPPVLLRPNIETNEGLSRYFAGGRRERIRIALLKSIRDLFRLFTVYHLRNQWIPLILSQKTASRPHVGTYLDPLTYISSTYVCIRLSPSCFWLGSTTDHWTTPTPHYSISAPIFHDSEQLIVGLNLVCSQSIGFKKTCSPVLTCRCESSHMSSLEFLDG